MDTMAYSTKQEFKTSSTVRVCGSLQTDTPASGDGAYRLLRLAGLTQERAAEPVAKESRELAARVCETRFYLVGVGQFKRGKSNPLNALVGQEPVPKGVVPVTAVPTVIRFDDEFHARIRMREGIWQDIEMNDLKEYVTEELNSKKREGGRWCGGILPSPLLSSGMCLVDAPGLGATFTGKSAAAQDFIPHIDAALVVLGSDPPIGGEELVEKTGQQIDELILVINKADRTSDPERAATVKFTRAFLDRNPGCS